MELKLMMVVVLLSVAMCPQSDAWFIRFRRIVKEVKKVLKPVCPVVCPRVCSFLPDGSSCQFVCSGVCGRKRRDLLSEDTHVTLLPRNLDFYDLNDDGFVVQQEIAITFGHRLGEAGLSKAFNLTDIDQDGRLTEDELFFSETFIFAPAPTPEDSTA